MRKEIFTLFKWYFGRQVRFYSGSFNKVLQAIKSSQSAFSRRVITPEERKELKSIFKERMKELTGFIEESEIFKERMK